MTLSTCIAYVILIETVTLVASTALEANDLPGCFKNPEIFEEYTRYIQPLSMENRIYYEPAASDNPVKMLAKTDPTQPKYQEKMYTCLEEYDDNRMLVEVKDTVKDKTHYQCLKFTSLTRYILRQSKTRLRSSSDKLNCEKDKYTTDEALLMAFDMLDPQPCPLTGGYQMILHEGEVIKAHCLDNILTYNPSIRFQCDGHNVVADFGRDCEPPKLRSLGKLGNRHSTHLSCVGSWTENKDISSVLLRMTDMPFGAWCVHYKRMNGSNDFLSVFITLDGRCVENAFHDESFPGETSMFGQLASYVPSNDPSCSNPEHLEACKQNEATCFESTQCPANCQRCNFKVAKSSAMFEENTQGTWMSVNSDKDIVVNVTGNNLEVSGFGSFSKWRDVEPTQVHPVVQSDDTTSCMPYYACAHLSNPISGVLNFKLYPSWRDEGTGNPLSCLDAEVRMGTGVPVKEEQMTTLVSPEKLKKTPCDFEMSTAFPTRMDTCMVEVEECRGDCHQLSIHYNNDTCAEHPNYGFEIEADHVCYGKFNFDRADNVTGLLTYSEFSDRYFCWIFTSRRLFIASPSACNVEGVMRISRDEKADIKYDPAAMLMKPMRGKIKEKKGPGGKGGRIFPNYLMDLVISICLLALLDYFR